MLHCAYAVAARDCKRLQQAEVAAEVGNDHTIGLYSCPSIQLFGVQKQTKACEHVIELVIELVRQYQPVGVR